MNYKEKAIKSQESLKLLLKSEKSLTTKAKFGPSKETKIPLEINEEIALLSSSIIGDGHLKKSKFQITLEATNPSLPKIIQRICLKQFERKFNITPVKSRKNKKDTTTIRIDSKSIFLLLNIALDIPSGKKSRIVKVPEEVKKSNNSIKAAFIIGILLTEGGKRRRGIGISSASETLRDDVVKLLRDLKIKAYIDKWTHRKNKKEYYGFYFKEKEIKNIIRQCKNEKIRQDIKKFRNLNI